MTTQPEDTRAAPAQEIHSAVAAYYGTKFAQHGASSLGVDWRDAAGQRLRHSQFDRLIAGDPDASAIDFGCGYGDYLTYLRGAGHRGHYTGYDLVPEMIAAARKMHGTETCDWRVGHAIEEPADFVVASGIFNVKGDVPHDEWAAYMQRTVDEMAKAARKGIGFNVLSSVVAPERRRADLFFADPAEWLTYTMRRFGRRVCILQDSGLFEFTLIQFKD